MMHTFLEWDKQLFSYINEGLANPFFDWLMPLAREKLTWIPLYLFLLVFLPLRYRIKGFYAILTLAIAVALSDVVCSDLFKPLFHRLRPCRNPQMAGLRISRIPCGAGFSFVSSHAANHFAVAVFLSLLLGKPYRWLPWIAIPWAALIAFAQVYVGVHFPADVLVGAMIGTAIAGLCFHTARRCRLLPVGPGLPYYENRISIQDISA